MNRRTKITIFAFILAVCSMLELPAAAAPLPSELLLAERMDDAVGALRSHLQSAPNDPEAHCALLRAYMALQRWDAAVSEGQKAVSLAPNNSEYHMWLGRAYGEKADHSSWTSALGLARKTRNEFERAVALNDRNAGARSDLAEYYISAPSFLGGGKDKAAAQAEVLRSQGNEAMAHWISAKIAETEKNYGRAEEELRASIQVSKNAPERMLDLASFYRRRGRVSEAEAMVNQAVASATRSPYSPTLYEAADLLYRAGRNLSGAVDMLRSYIASGPHSTEAPLFRAHYLLGNILEKMGNKSGAAEQYRTTLSLASNFEPAQSALKKLQ